MVIEIDPGVNGRFRTALLIRRHRSLLGGKSDSKDCFVSFFRDRELRCSGLKWKAKTEVQYVDVRFPLPKRRFK